MIRKASLLLVSVFVLSVFAGPVMAQLQGYPAPRYPVVHRITSVDQLMEVARHLVNSPGTGVMRPGYAPVNPGDRVLIAVSERTDPLVIEALKLAFQEQGATVHLYLTHADPTPTLEDLWTPEAQSEVNPRWLVPNYRTPPPPTAAEQREALWMATFDLVPGRDSLPNGRRMQWPTREILASPAITYPEEILYAIDRAGWGIIRQAERVRITDAEGTDVSFSYFPEYWQVVEGTHPEIHTRGGGPGTARREGYTYGIPGASEHPLIPGHLMGVPEGIVLDKSDGEGVFVATQNHRGYFPKITLTMSQHRVVKVEGGGRYGEMWREFYELYDDRYKYPMNQGREGHGQWVEAAIGINPKVTRTHNLYESITARRSSSFERMRSAIIHLGFGNVLAENDEWAMENNLPVAWHFHLHLNYATYDATLRDGRTVRLIDKGHLTTLDDPEIRRIAARFGDPDELLREDWIPATPGINAPGSYEDYARDPYSFVREDYRKHYAEELKFTPYP